MWLGANWSDERVMSSRLRSDIEEYIDISLSRLKVFMMQVS